MSYYPCYQIGNVGCGPQVQYVPQCTPFITPYCGPTGATGAYGPIGPTGGKTFIIDHPIDSNRYLVHGCLEGPELGIYYRGKASIIDDVVTIHLPDYVRAIGSEFTVQITPIFNGVKRTTNYEVTEVLDGSFSVYGPSGDFFWHVYGKRSNLQVEPIKSEVEVKGSGPYQWL